MYPMKSEEIKGIYGPVQLAVNADDSIDYHAISETLDRFIAFGIHGLYTNGSSGEFWSQTEEEFERISALTAEKAEKAGIPFQLGASHFSPQVTLERIKRIKHLNPGAIQVVLADWYPLSNEAAVACLERFAEFADPIKLVLYNPPHAKRVLAGADYAFLKERVPAIIGSKSAAWQDILDCHIRDLSVFCGGTVIAEGRQRGATGSYSQIACLHPEKAVRWFELAENDTETATGIGQGFKRWRDKYIAPLMQNKEYCGAAVDKLYASIGGWSKIGPRMRWPYQSFTQEMVRTHTRTIREEVPEFFEL